MESENSRGGGGVSRGREDRERHARLLQRKIQEVEGRPVRCHQADKAVLGDFRVATVEFLAKKKEEDKKKREWEEARASRIRCEVVKEEARRKEAGFIQELKNKANQLKELRAKMENHTAYCQGSKSQQRGSGQ